MSREGISKRDLVTKLAMSDVVRGLEIARSVRDPWYRSQSLAHVAWHLKDHMQFKQVVGEALSAAYEQDEPNRVVTVASWTVRVMVKRGEKGSGRVVHELLSKLQLQPNPVRRADALLVLFEAVYYEPRLRDFVLDALLRECEQMNSWKRPRILGAIALVFAIDEPNRADKIVDMIGDGRKSRQVRREIAARTWIGPHEFFPYYAKPS